MIIQIIQVIIQNLHLDSKKNKESYAKANLFSCA